MSATSKRSLRAISRFLLPFQATVAHRHVRLIVYRHHVVSQSGWVRRDMHSCFLAFFREPQITTRQSTVVSNPHFRPLLLFCTILNVQSSSGCGDLPRGRQVRLLFVDCARDSFPKAVHLNVLPGASFRPPLLLSASSTAFPSDADSSAVVSVATFSLPLILSHHIDAIKYRTAQLSSLTPHRR